jgi:hypothetical protein
MGESLLETNVDRQNVTQDGIVFKYQLGALKSGVLRRLRFVEFFNN